MLLAMAKHRAQAAAALEEASSSDEAELVAERVRLEQKLKAQE